MRSTTARDLLAAARGYLARGFAPIPVPPRRKGPVLKGWQRLRLTDDALARYFSDGGNVGIRLGKPSGGLIDVDLDVPEAVTLAGLFLPKTGAVFGRPGNPRSHYLYVCPGLTTKQFEDADEDETMLVELRSTGGQTIFPPSIHPSGETVRWDARGDPDRVDAVTLHAAVRQLAACTLLARHWPRKKGSRHRIVLALSGYLLRGGLAEDGVRKIVLGAARTAGDEEAKNRLTDVMTTRKRRSAGQTVTGGPTLVKLLGDKVVTKLADYLELRGAAVPPAPATSGDNGDGPVDLARQPLTDVGNSRRLVALHGRELRYHPTRGAWLLWSGKRWESDATLEAERRAKQTIDQLLVAVALKEVA